MESCDYGIFGLGVMGGNLSLNLARQGVVVAAYDRLPEKGQELLRRATELGIKPGFIHVFSTVEDFVGSLKLPRKIHIEVNEKELPKAVAELLPRTSPGDLLVDGGNSFFKETQKIADEVKLQGRMYLAMGISGGEEAALNGACIMAGGTEEAYELELEYVKKIALKTDDGPALAFWTSQKSDHDTEPGDFVKMVHNGIEYGVLQLIAETIHLLQNVLNFSTEQVRLLLISWKRDTKSLDLRSHLLDLTIGVLGKIDDTGKPLVESILDSAEQKGTGMRASQTGMELFVPMPTIDAAVAARNISSCRKARDTASDVYRAVKVDTTERLLWSDSTICEKLKEAFYCSELITCAQGFDLLLKGCTDPEHEYNYTLAEVCQVWKRGALIRASLLDIIERAYSREPKLLNLLLDYEVADRMQDLESSLRFIVRIANSNGIPIPAMNASLDYFDSLRSEKLPANIIQAIRDSFGAHKYHALDNPTGDSVHTIWPKSESSEELFPTPFALTSEVEPNKLLVALKFTKNMIVESLKHPGKGFVISSETGEIESG